MTLNKAVLECVIDHLMLSASDLGVGKAWVRSKAWRDGFGWRQPSWSTHAQPLAGLTEQCYLEVIAPDPAQALKATLSE